jgi:hypothetical protein
MKLLDNQTTITDGTQEVWECTGGQAMIQATGAFDGAIVTLQGSMEGFDFVDLTDEAGDVLEITEPIVVASGWNRPGFRLRASLVNAGAATNVSVGLLV